MKFEDIIKHLESLKYREYPARQEWREWGVRCFSRRIPEGTPCKTNDYKISWHVNAWPEMRLGQNDFSTPNIEVEIVGEHEGGLWLKLQAYCLDMNNLEASLAQAERMLLTLWQTAWAWRADD